MSAMYGKKLGMTRIFTEAGEAIAVTVLEMIPNVVYQVKSKDKEGYDALQVGIGSQKQQRVDRAMTSHMAKAQKGFVKELRELRLDREGRELDYKQNVGEEVKMDGLFQVGDLVDVTGISIGKGFAGVMKRHNMKGAQTVSHGTHEYKRHAGSIGNRKFPGRVFKNKRMSGHMGSERVTQQALTVLQVRPEDNALLIKGSVPGPKNGLVFVQASVKE